MKHEDRISALIIGAFAFGAFASLLVTCGVNDLSGEKLDAVNAQALETRRQLDDLKTKVQKPKLKKKTKEPRLPSMQKHSPDERLWDLYYDCAREWRECDWDTSRIIKNEEYGERLTCEIRIDECDRLLRSMHSSY